jgi:hypothetical protein
MNTIDWPQLLVDAEERRRDTCIDTYGIDDVMYRRYYALIDWIAERINKRLRREVAMTREATMLENGALSYFRVAGRLVLDAASEAQEAK